MNLIERLRNLTHGLRHNDGYGLIGEAADEIDRLTQQLDSMQKHESSLEDKDKEIERLTGELAKYKDLIFKLQEWRADELAERDALKAALQLIKANTNTLDWPDDINAAIQGAGK